MNTGENTQGLRKIMEFTRLLSIIILLIHFYLSCYAIFAAHQLQGDIFDRILAHLLKLRIFQTAIASKAAALVILALSQLGTKGKKDEKSNPKNAVWLIITGLITYWSSGIIFYLSTNRDVAAIAYMCLTSTGYLLSLSGSTLLSRYLNLKFATDTFNTLNETFPQQEQLLSNEYSLNLPARYNLRGQLRNSWINIINPFRGLLVSGTPGSGKSYFVIRHLITQHIQKGFSMLVYDFKFDDLSIIAYNALLKNQSSYLITPKFYVLDLDKVRHRCNPLSPDTLFDLSDAAESARTIMLGLNREWIKKQGDFFVESPINFLTAIIWFLRKYQNGVYCSLPHAIELLQLDYKQLFPILNSEPEVQVLINPFISALENEAQEQLEGQVGGAKIALARLSSPTLYYIMTGSDFTLDINNPAAPKILCIGNNPQKNQVYGAVLSLYVNRLLKLISRKNQHKCSLIFDEFPTIYLSNISEHLGYARGYKIATCLGLQDLSQLRKDYGREQAEVIMNVVGNIISGQVTGDTAKQLSERIGKIIQQKQSVSVNSADTSVSHSTQLDVAVPPSTIAGLSSGEFVGMVADDPDNKIGLKAFHAEFMNDHKALKAETESYQPIPEVANITAEQIKLKYQNIRQDVQTIADDLLRSEKKPAHQKVSEILPIEKLIPESEDTAIKASLISLLKCLQKKPQRLSTMQEELNLGKNDLKKYLALLKTAKLVQFTGPLKNGKYEVNKNGEDMLKRNNHEH